MVSVKGKAFNSKAEVIDKMVDYQGNFFLAGNLESHCSLEQIKSGHYWLALS